MRTIQRNTDLFKKGEDGRVSVIEDLHKILAQTDIGVYVDAWLVRANMSAEEKEEAEKASEAKNKAFEGVAAACPPEVMDYLQDCASNAPPEVREALMGIRVLKLKTPEQRQRAKAANVTVTVDSSESDFDFDDDKE